MNETESPKTGLSVAEYEAQGREIAISLLRKADAFAAWDLEFNKSVSDLMGLYVERARENPELLDAGMTSQGLTESTYKTEGSLIGYLLSWEKWFWLDIIYLIFKKETGRALWPGGPLPPGTVFNPPPAPLP